MEFVCAPSERSHIISGEFFYLPAAHLLLSISHKHSEKGLNNHLNVMLFTASASKLFHTGHGPLPT